MPVSIIDISEAERDKILALRESHFCDFKSILIKPAKLTRTIAALSNAEGGEVYIGVEEDKDTRANIWHGFNVRRTQTAICKRSNRSSHWARGTLLSFYDPPRTQG